MEEKSIEKDKIELKCQVNISPSSINTWFKCPRSYFYNYICKIKTKPNIHLIKGSIVHKVMEDMFKGYKPNLQEHMNVLFAKTWESYEQRLKNLELSDEELGTAKRDCINMVNEYYISVDRKMTSLINLGKAENERHAYFLIKPKFREMFVKDEDLHCVGYIDRVHKDFDGLITLGDYKTSSKYGIGLPADYKRQLAIYSLLYGSQEKVIPDFSAVIFLRYGEEYFLEVTPSLLKYARDTIIETYAKTRSTSIEDYPIRESNLCRWCDFHPICTGEEDWEKRLRIQNLKSKLKKK